MLVIGQIIGGIIAMFLLSALIEWAIVKRVMDDPRKGALVSVGAAWFMGSLFHALNTGAQGLSFLLYLPGALIVAIFYWIKRKPQPEEWQ